MNMTDKIRQYLLEHCKMDLVGFARPSEVDSDSLRCDEILPGAKSVIVFAKKISDGALQAAFRMHEDGNAFAAASYATYACEMTPNMEIFFAGFDTAKYIERSFGVVAMPIPCNPLHNMTSINKPLPAFAGPTRRYELVDMKRAVVASGLGEIGWSNWPLTPQYGPRQMFGIILTQLELDYSEPYSGEKLCKGEECGICSAVCPTHAIPAFDGESEEICVGDKCIKCAAVNKNACAVASLAFRKEFSGRFDAPDQIMNNNPSDDELADAYAAKPISHHSLDHFPKHYCNKCMIYCPVGGWKERFADKGLTSFGKEESAE